MSDYLVAFEHAALHIERHVERVGGTDWHPDITGLYCACGASPPTLEAINDVYLV